MDEQLKSLVAEIMEKFNPVSVFLYGSRARNDFLSKSDYEVGVLYFKDKKISRTDLKSINSNNNINIYPF